MDGRSRNPIRVLAALIGGVALLAIGAYAGYDVGLKSGIQEGFFCNALHTGTYVSVLRGLKKTEIEPASRLLEVSLNAGVILMTPDQDILEERTKKAVNDTLLKVKSYRDEHPWSGAEPDVNARVTKALASVASQKK